MTAAMRAQDLSVALGGSTVLHGVTMALQPGWTAIVGPNGAGKSTLLRALAGLLPRQAGQVWLQGRPLDDWSDRERALHIAWLAQQGQAQGDLTVRELVQLGRLPHLGLFGTPGVEDERAVDAAMQATECTAWAQRRLQQLSGGERQRCLLARALAVGAPVLLLDEPTTHLDAPHQVALARLFGRLARGTTALGERRGVVTVLHDLPIALHADRVLVMQAGRIVASGTPTQPHLHRALEQVFDDAVRVRAGSVRAVVSLAIDEE
jgi:iron complex transport system ATP-binding protein